MNFLTALLHEDEENKYLNVSFVVLFALLSIALVWVVILSLQWRMVHDSPIMLYIAFLMDKFGYIPYKDIFDMNLPATYLLYYIIGHFSNYTDFGFRIADILFLAGILISTWYWLRRISWKVAWCATVIFGLLYLSWGPIYSLQREYMLLLPVSLALLLTLSVPNLNNMVRWFLVGSLCGFSFLIKPHSIIFFAAIAIYQIVEFCKDELKGKIAKMVLMYLTGFLIPNLIALVYLWVQGALAYFIDSVSNYLPLYGKLTGSHMTISGADRLKYLITEYISFGAQTFSFGNLAAWLFPTILGAYLSFRSASLTKQQKNTIWLLIGLTVLASIYPVFSGQFWPYHYFLFLYFAVISSSFCFISLSNTNYLTKILPVILFFLVFSSEIYILPQVLEFAKTPPRNGFVDQLAYRLQSDVQEGDTVQPLDWTAGAVHAMLIAKVRIATPFIYDFHFYHHISNPYIQNLRKRFIKDLKGAAPKYIVNINLDYQPPVSGKDTTRTFPELENMIKTQYKIGEQNRIVTIYEKNEAANATQ